MLTVAAVKVVRPGPRLNLFRRCRPTGVADEADTESRKGQKSVGENSDIFTGAPQRTKLLLTEVGETERGASWRMKIRCLFLSRST